jgi:hypothetical protein
LTIRIEGIVTQEAREWITEFQSNMAQLEKDVKVQLDALKSQVEKNASAKAGAIELEVPNADKADGFKFQVLLENKNGTVATEEVTSTTWVRIAAAAGQYQASVSATVGGKPLAGSAVADVKPGEIVKPSILLPAA